MHKPVLSKSSYIRGLQCFKSLFLYKKNYQLRDYLSPEQVAKFKRGSDVGVLAQQLFPGGTNASSGSHRFMMKSLERTKLLIDTGCKVIYEASFLFNEVFAAVDILVNESGMWTAYEVKSSLGLSETYYHDASLQYYVITNSGMALNDFVLIHMNPGYVRKERLDLSGLFVQKSVIEHTKQQLSFVEENVNRMKLMLESPDLPSIKIGMHCDNPYPCDFKGFCRNDIPASGTVFQLYDLKPEQQYELFNKGIINLVDLSEKIKLSDKQQIVIRNEEYLNTEAFLSFTDIGNYSGNIVFLDLLTFSPAVPLFAETSPYCTIPYLYTLMSCDTNGNVVDSEMYYSEAGLDDRGAFLQKLFQKLQNDKKLFMYSTNSFEEIFQNSKINTPSKTADLYELSNVLKQLIYFNPNMKPDEDAVVIANKLNKQRGNKPLFSSETTAAEAYKNLFYSNDIFESADTKEKLVNYSFQRVKALKDIFFYLLKKARF
jgi:hypothetical protein